MSKTVAHVSRLWEPIPLGSRSVRTSIQSPNSWTFTESWKVDFSKRAVFSKVREYNRAQTSYIFCVHISVTIMFENIKQILTSLNDWTFIFSIENIHNIFGNLAITLSPQLSFQSVSEFGLRTHFLVSFYKDDIKTWKILLLCNWRSRMGIDAETAIVL
jgi:hypothetical protein